MNIEQLKALIKQGESSTLEFKKSTTQIKPAFETVCAFLNGTGGTVIFGIKNDGELIGQHVTDSTKQELANEIRKIEPNSQLQIYYIPLNKEREVIVLEIQAGNHTPYAYDGRPFERNQSTTHKMSQHRYEQLIVRRGQLNHQWDHYAADAFTLDDLDHEEIRKTIVEGVNKHRIGVEVLNHSIEQILTSLGLIIDNKLTNAAIVLFCKNIPKIFPQCELKMARFRGTDKLGDFIDNQWISGNAFQLIIAAHHFATRHLPIAGFFEPNNWQRTDQPAVPALALREALINSICHRDYSNRSCTTSLAIFDDRLEIWNIGKLSPELSIDHLKIPHRSILRNRAIAQVFYKRGWIENWGIGTIRMTDYCKSNGTPEPQFVEDGGGFSVIFRFSEPMTTGIQQPSAYQDLSPRQEEILKLLERFGEMSLQKIRDGLTTPPATSTLGKDLTSLKTNGLIVSRGHSRATVWNIARKK